MLKKCKLFIGIKMSKEKFMNLLSLIALDVFFHLFYPCLINNAANELLLFAGMVAYV